MGISEERQKLKELDDRAKRLDLTVRALKAEEKALEGQIAADTGGLAGLLALAELGEADHAAVDALWQEIRRKKLRRNEIPLAVSGLQTMEKTNHQERVRTQKHVWRYEAAEDYQKALTTIREAGWSRELEEDLRSSAHELGKVEEAEEIIRGATIQT